MFAASTEDPTLDYSTIGEAVRMASEAGMPEGPYMLYAHPETLPAGWMPGGVYDLYVDGAPVQVAVSDDLKGKVCPALGLAR